AGDAKAVAKVGSVGGALLERDKSGWRSLKANDDVAAGRLLVSMPRSELVSANGNVTLVMLSDIGMRGPFSGVGAGVVLDANDKVDLDVTLDRGVVGVANRGKEGEAKVKLRVAGETWTLTLRDPGTKVALELFGRHPPGMPKNLKKIDAPTIDLIMLVLEG